jgi:dCTP deaminase
LILSDNDIKNERAFGRVTIEPFIPENLGVNSYDVTLSNYFALLKYQGTVPWFYMTHVPDGEKLLIPVGETVLAFTNEIAGGNGTITTMIKARSTTRRLGISICDCAGLGEVGYVRRWTMELTANTSPYAVVTVGMRIAQIVFLYCCSKPDHPYDGQYATEEWPKAMVPKAYRDNIRWVTYMGSETLMGECWKMPLDNR